jgi:hypothetical protein
MKIWLDSGRYRERGRGLGRYCMSRPGDRGGYEVGNVLVCANEANWADYSPSPETRAALSAAGKRRWRRRRAPAERREAA